MIRTTIIALLTACLAISAFAQGTDDLKKQLEKHQASNDRDFEVNVKKIDDVLWHFKLGDIAKIDKFRIASSKPRREKNATDQNAGNAIILPLYVFTPKNVSGKAPLVLLVHGGVHGDFESNYAYIVREMLEEGYVVAAPEYRGSTGYGGDLYDQIDYGGTEVDDVHDARNWCVENLEQVDPRRVGIIGWSHGGYQTLLNIFRWPDDYQVAYAGVPVSDLVQRMAYKGPSYAKLFEEFVGKDVVDDVNEYRRRSPVYHADKLRTPLLIHTTTNDEDVNVLEVEHLIAALKAAGKKFESRIYKDAPGGHRFNRIDTKLARDSRREIWNFLAEHLKPRRSNTSAN